MNVDIVTGVRQAVQHFVAPGIQEARGEIRALEARLAALEKVSEARFSEIDTRIDARFSEVNTKLDAPLNLRDLQVRITKIESQRTA